MFDSQYKILYIEDDKVDQMAFKHMVKQRGLQYDFVLAGSAKEAREKIAQDKYDLILIDYQLGDGSAFDIFPFMQGTPFIFTTGEGDEEIAARALRAGASDYLIKDQERNYLMLLPYAIYTSINRSANIKRLQLLESVVVNANDAIVVLESHPESPLELEAVYLNRAFIQMSGFQLKEMMNRSWEILFSHENDEAVQSKVKEAFVKQTPLQIELFNQRKDGAHYWVEINLVPIINEEDERIQYVIVQRDVTDRKVAEQALIKARMETDEAREREKRFLANISHEIRNPIQTVLNIVHLLRVSELTPKQEKYVGSLKFTADFMVGLLSDLLEKAKIEAGEIQFEEIEFELPTLLNKICNIYQYRANEKNLNIVCNLHPDIPPKVIGDPTKLQQILSNLVSNAIKFTSEGEIRCEVSSIGMEGKKMQFQFCIIDTGIGIPSEKLNSIFDPYKQADSSTTRKYGGTGLGLSIVKHLVEGQGGRIWVESEEGKGSNFWIEIGLKIPNASVDKKRTQKLLDTSVLKDKQLLLVEDNPSNQVLISKLLENHGVKVITADNGLMALETLRSRELDIILTDLNMPDMDGEELIRNIRLHDQTIINELPIIVLSGATDPEAQKRLNQFHIDGFLTKPIQPNVLVQKIAELISQRANYSPKSTLPLKRDELLDLGPLYRVSRQNPKFVRDMIKIYLDLTPRALEQMREALKIQDWLYLNRTAHFIKSTFNTTGNQELFHLTLEIEEISKKHPDLIALEERLERVEEICENLGPRLENFLNTEMSSSAATKV